MSDVRVLGAIGVIELEQPGGRRGGDGRGGRARACGCARSRDLIYAMPPYVTSGEDLERIAAAMVAAACAGSTP